MLKLYDYFRSSSSFRVRIALNLKELDYQAIPIHLLNNGGEQFGKRYQKINPHSLVPALEHQDVIITQSLAIIEYLDETYPHPALLPTNAAHKALVRSFALSIAADLHPLNNLRVMKYLSSELNITEEKKTQWYQHWIKVGLTGLEEQLRSQALLGRFCFGDTPTLADVCLVPQLFNARRFSCDLSAYPELIRIDANCQLHDAFTKAWPAEAVA
jgi:maleylpyruvate isomerase